MNKSILDCGKVLWKTEFTSGKQDTTEKLHSKLKMSKLYVDKNVDKGAF
ncbi:hypothetical protein [uncultured Chryseobacterium sp.]|nr:hypothetical protein [uncultured Chryseobacterium sp.]